ncbi:MAG: hypothetical protein ACRDTA_10980 [Pseudonocardiaceae bacterium]
MSPLIGVPTRLTMTMPAPADATAPLHLMGHPASYVDASGRMAFLVVLMIAAIAAATLGAVGAAANKVKTWDELVLWVIGGASGAVWGWREGGSWNNLNASGCGNPFEKTAHTFTGDPATARSTSDCRRRAALCHLRPPRPSRPER